ncbi:DUF2577 family protein [Paenibacillus kribbensis]|uniref:DUF2577 family protein n=1 Tax=Paenibacillus kribbensis TaxID=172713 RepID=UPI002DB5F682|nr:DUF2577 family protein [Paenibacillus kribbensis]MEC0234467.1 DUF2577 family protein [Paenibacillus kribbensis]
MALSDTLKLLSKSTNDAGNPVGVYYGTVTASDPLAILVDQKLPLPKEALVLLKDASFKAGDPVVLLRFQGGNQYLVMGEVET